MWPNPHDSIEFPFYIKVNLLAKIAPLYKQGLSLRDIAFRMGIPRTTIRAELLRGGISLRPSGREQKIGVWGKSGRRTGKPPFGFCYLEGEITRNPKEYPVLCLIHERWKASQPANSIATWLNEKRVPSPLGKAWSGNSVTNIINRFKDKTVSSSGGHFELR